MTPEAPYNYKRILKIPDLIHRPKDSAREAGDRRLHPVYVYTEDILLAINVALATHRPLLVRGPSGSGKSTLAKNVADKLERRFYEQVITSRTQAQDLLWDVDLLRRLHDAQIAAHKEGRRKNSGRRFHALHRARRALVGL